MRDTPTSAEAENQLVRDSLALERVDPAHEKYHGIFLSHTGVDKPFVCRLRGDLLANSVPRVWLDGPWNYGYDLASGCHGPEGNERLINLRSGRVLMPQPLHEDGVIVPLTDYRRRGTAKSMNARKAPPSNRRDWKTRCTRIGSGSYSGRRATPPSNHSGDSVKVSPNHRDSGLVQS